MIGLGLKNLPDLLCAGKGELPVPACGCLSDCRRAAVGPSATVGKTHKK